MAVAAVCPDGYYARYLDYFGAHLHGCSTQPPANPESTQTLSQWNYQMELVEDFAIEDVDPALASSAFAAGFVLVGTAWAIGISVRVILRAIKGGGP